MTQLFRITHVHNLPFILKHGLHCSDSDVQDPNFTQIGFPSLIEYRKDREVPVPPGGSLSQYIPFYFWYRSPMLFVIHKGNDPEVLLTPQEEIVYLVSSFESLQKVGSRFIFTDRHAKLDYANFYQNPADIANLNWELIRTEHWGRQYGPERKEQKQAECLVYQAVPLDAIVGIAVLNEEVKNKVEQYIFDAGCKIPVKVRSNFYF